MSGFLSAGIVGGPDIPDSGDLQARYDFSVEDGSMPVADQTGNGYDLGTGSYSGVSVSINGTQAGEFDGVDDLTNTSFATNQTQPNHIFIVAEYISIDTGGANALFDGDGTFQHAIESDYVNSSGEYAQYAGTFNYSNTSADAGDIVVISALFDGANSVLRVNGNEHTGDAGTRELDGVTLGNLSNSSQPANVKIGEVLVYPQDKSAKVTDIESYLTDKWGPTSFA